MAPGLGWLALFLVVPCASSSSRLLRARHLWRRRLRRSPATISRRAVESLYLVDLPRLRRAIAADRTLVALLIGYPAAYRDRQRAEARQMPLLFLVMLPFWTNYLIRTYAWIVLLNREGLINNALHGARPDQRTAAAALQRVRGRASGLVYGYVPFMILALYSSISQPRPRALSRPRPISAPRAMAHLPAHHPAADRTRHRGRLRSSSSCSRSAIS